MIDLEQVAIFKKFNGELDARTRMADSAERDLVSEDAWRQIERLLQDLYLVDAGLASQHYRHQLDVRLRETCRDAATVDAIRALARQRPL